MVINLFRVTVRQRNVQQLKEGHYIYEVSVYGACFTTVKVKHAVIY